MKVLVTGAGGFIGGALARRLHGLGYQVRSLQRGSYPQLEEDGIATIQGQLTDPDVVSDAVAGCAAVFHVAALAAVSGPYSQFHNTNVIGTEQIIASCRKHRVEKLIYTSSPSVVFDGQDQEGIDESVPYPASYLAHYPQTKALAEKAILTANGPELATVALRPHLVWGPGDRHLIPRILDRGQSGKLKLIQHNGALLDATYIENAIDAHIAAFKSLAPDSPCCGKPYFIANDEPVAPEVLIGGILQSAGLAPVKPSISPQLAFAIGTVLEWVHRIPGWPGEPILTRFTARQLSTSHWFDLSAARRDLNWEPRISTAEGLRKLALSLSPQTEPTS
jgi:nucleoside-diphosphate-sugar epimerase